MNITEENATRPCNKVDLQVTEIKVMMVPGGSGVTTKGRSRGGCGGLGGMPIWG